MSTLRHFFFYGTLRRGLGNEFSENILAKFAFVAAGTVAGRLYLTHGTIGPYPVLMPGRGRVAGDLCRMLPRFTARDLKRLDAYEDYVPDDPACSRYLRKVVAVSVAPGRRVAAWCYIHNGRLPRGAPLIASGDFADVMRVQRAQGA